MVWVLAQLECGPAKVQKRVSFRGATFGARGQHGMRTFRGPEANVGTDFDVGPAPDAKRGRSSTAGFDPRPTRAPSEARPAGVYDTVCRGATTCQDQRDGRVRASFGPITRNKSGHAQSHRVGRTCKQACNGSSREGSGMLSAQHLPDSPTCNLARLCRRGAGSRKHSWACDEGLGFRAVHACIH
jgi:hypothetical protein